MHEGDWWALFGIHLQENSNTRHILSAGGGGVPRRAHTPDPPTCMVAKPHSLGWFWMALLLGVDEERPDNL